MHEAKEGEYDFTGGNDVVGFIQMAQAAGLLVVVRAGQLHSGTLILQYMARGQNHVIKSGYCCKQTPDLTIWRKSNQKYRCIGIWLTIRFSKCNQ